MSQKEEKEKGGESLREEEEVRQRKEEGGKGRRVRGTQGRTQCRDRESPVHCSSPVSEIPELHSVFVCVRTRVCISVCVCMCVCTHIDTRAARELCSLILGFLFGLNKLGLVPAHFHPEAIPHT